MEITISSVSFLSVLIPITFLLIRIRKISRTFLLFGLILIISFLVDLTVTIFVANTWKYSLILNIYTIIETLLFLILYFRIEPFSSRKFAIPILLLLLLVFGWLTFNYSNGFSTFNSKFRSVECLMVIIFSGLLMIHESNYSLLPLFKNSLFCLNSVLLIYFSISLSIFSIADLILIDHPTEIAKLWVIPMWLNIFCNLSFTYCFWCNSQATN